MLLYFLFFYYLYLYYYNRKYKSPLLDFILLFYIAASVCGILTHYIAHQDAYSTILSIIFQIACLYLFIRPIIVYGKNGQDRQIILLDDKRFKILSYTLIVLQLFTIAFFAKSDFLMLQRGDLAQIRAEIIHAELGSGASIWRTIAGVASYYYCFNILLFFYSLAFRQDNKFFLFLLIASSISRIFHALTYMGRDGVLFWILSFAFSYYLFLPYLKEKAKRHMFFVFLGFGGFAITILGAISISRFENTGNGTLLSLIDYFGSPLNNFGLLFDRFHEYQGTKILFPLLWGERGISGAEAIENAENFYLRYGFYSNSFFSFVGNMYKAWGPFITLLISLLYSLILSKYFTKKYVSFSNLIVLMFAGQMLLHNYFYWAYSIRVGNLFVFSLPLFIIFCNKNKGIAI